ncbi:hypothetical protein Tco_1042547, partial [Tanacetum coccineum]
TMMVQAHKEIGKGLEIPTDPHHTSIITQPSSSQPQRKQKSKKFKKKNTEVSQPSGSTDNVPDENVSTTSNHPLLSGEDRLKLTELMDLWLKRLRKVGSAKRVESSDEASFGDQEDASKKGRKITDIDADARWVMIQEPSKFKTKTTTTTPAALKPSQNKGKAKMIESEKPLKKKDQIMSDQEVALNLQAQLQAELE